ncbi:acetyl-CoA carboxylase biotin carboxyl carrier protein [Leuconostoc mesenteroides]|uniref:acetyl-CoA carboxylase biotin carboxyl carrier protein n=1 Tax=Leuconostoc mesenteroides TaxID=1245 RepID=UPI000A06F091|nr:biotin/lipoyl-containing protein [Leuconostoc mesenteroides]ARN63439.1 acetyl-CoA carboxylase biotin carboxyl carrier protein subunit [Leuconostoc mesenteroides subsp. mesenteroides]MCT8385829.1 acetyl-CoA carboxylase biotin carboxyl carrier protein subunit [Leuconostoc mesenteroides]MDV8926679.1 acetyl-CoA carboxylase biotin carboxyl carrier protein subunit [Leuconostoc mesenteroides]ORI90953.1 acetyl-CoA carboxylase biotin carboxyl carrier protein subunit [Leuconostoc mesenteroides subsp. 
MKIEDISAIVKLLNDNNLSNVSFKEGESEISVSKELAVARPEHVLTPAKTENQSNQARYIVSPTIGTFYSSSDPNSAPFVAVGQKVTKSTVVGIVEAMKMMTNILADGDGVIAEILVTNGEAIEYGQKLFRLG